MQAQNRVEGQTSMIEFFQKKLAKAKEQHRRHITTTDNIVSFHPPSFKLSIMSSSFVSQIMEPGGGLLLIPFVRVIIGTLLVLTLAGFLAGVARIHMAILSFLSAGLLFSISMFEREFNKAQQNRGGGSSQAPPPKSGSSGKEAKSD